MSATNNDNLEIARYAIEEASNNLEHAEFLDCEEIVDKDDTVKDSAKEAIVFLKEAIKHLRKVK